MRVMRGLIMGCPGSGKGTQTKRIKDSFPAIMTLSSGDLLRDAINNNTELGILVKDIISKGELVSDHLITKMMTSHLERIPVDQSWILDGFPRTLDQAKALNSYLADTPLNFVINLDVPWDVILARIENRFIHLPSGRTYNQQFNPPKVPGKDDITGEPLTKRLDDNVQSFKIRLDQYQKLTVPLLDYYNSHGILYNFKGSTSDEITPGLNRAIRDFFSKIK